ncbi:MAG: SpoIID/LytB domain-containing protein [Planctomycetota bacterium]
MTCILTAAGCRRRPVQTTPGIDSPRQTWIRVLLFGNLRECTIASVCGFEVEDLASGTLAEFRNDESFDIRLSGEMLIIGEHRFGGEILIRPHEPHVFEINDKQYRGHLQLSIKEIGQTFEAINHVPLESYLFGVVGAAVASRTYCLFIKDRFGKNRSWDLTQSESSQVYRGLEAETLTIRTAVSETAGEILVAHATDSSEEVILSTYYSSSCGGHTEASENVFGGDSSPSLRGVQCSHCAGVARRSNYYWKPVKMTMQQINGKLMQRYSSLEKLEEISNFKVTKLGYKSRVVQVKLIGKNEETDTIRGEDFRLCLDPTGRKIKSAIFTVEKKGTRVTFQNGLGFGHGVGLCQCGTQGMARKGKTYKTILSYYFPKSKLVTIYPKEMPTKP